MPHDLAPISRRADAPDALPQLPAHLRWRPLRVDDATLLHGLVEAIELTDGARFRTTAAESAEKLTGEWKDLDHDTLVGVDDAGVVCAYATVELVQGAATLQKVIVHGGVHPMARDRGIGGPLVDWMTARARQVLVASGTTLPARIETHTDESGPAAERDLLERAGFRVRRYYANLRRDLADDVPDVQLPDGLRLVPWSDEIDDAMRLAHNDAFRDHWGSQPTTRENWRHGRSTFAPTWTFAVLDERDERPTVDGAQDAHASSGEGAPLVAAYLISGRYEQNWEAQGFTAGFTELLGVRRTHRGLGLSVALLEAAMRAYRADGMQFAELDVDTENPSGAHGLYASLGYEKLDGSMVHTIEV
ncbi:putative acetyltransferase, GNAT [Paraoerskovia sediminicola]|uniref:Acetyltransferase, GNAT n=1 Tax=Paraoerskovia sediminicola TaxID=1138587 RepID=A0ABN6XJ80_9CELL|nr:GNAT family N-acetyltransferase [Paraoerskovia sediminicola]BDZ43358.1 putative acetyltransferase, GNAT [Paraoerskovia sediminicola]